MGISVRRSALWIALAALVIAATALFSGGVSAVPGFDAGDQPTQPCNDGTGLADSTYTGAVDDPKCVDGNVAEGAPSCRALGFPNALELNRSPAADASDAYVKGALVGDGKYLDIAAGPGVTVLGAVIKGSNDANLYWGDLEGLHSPLTNSGNLPGIRHWTICYDVEEVPEPEDAKIWVSKKFEGPADWDFGFAFACENSDGSEYFTLGGGDSAHFEVGFDFHPQAETLTDDNGHYLLCGVLEEALAGDWTVNVTVTGTDEYDVGEDGGTLALFKVVPGADISVTFENIPGYLAKPPTGKVDFPG